MTKPSRRRGARSGSIGLWAALTLAFLWAAACRDITNPRIPPNDDTTTTNDSNLHGFLMPSLADGRTLTG